MIYDDFDLWIDERDGDHYPLKAEWLGVTARGELHLDPTAPEFAAVLAELEDELKDRAFSKQFGGQLYEALFQGEVRDLYQQGLGRVRGNNDAGLRIRLRIAPPELAALPWELLHDGDFFLATSTKTPLTRFIELRTAIKDLKTALPIRVLIVIPEGSGLDTAGETHGVINALSELGGQVEYQILDKDVTRQAIRDKLRENQFHIFHFIGHGEYSEDDQGCLILNSAEDGGPHPIGAEPFGLYFQNHPTTKLVILNSCEGAQVSATKPLAGMAPQIINTGVPAVIAMQYSIPDDVAKLFAREFYAELCRGPNRGRVDAAAASARLSICQDFDETNDFAIPVLFMRSPNGVIFSFESQAAPTSVKEAHTMVEVAKAHDYNAAALEEEKRLSTPEEAAQLDLRIQDETKSAQLAKQKVRQWRRRAILTSVVLASLLLSILVVNILEGVLNLDDFFETRFVALMDSRIEKPFSDDVRLIMIDEGDNGDVLGTFDPRDRANNPAKWRMNYAKLIRDLADAKAKVVAFDIYFLKADNVSAKEASANRCLAEAIAYARARQTEVIFGVEADDRGKVEAKMPAEIEQALDGSWGDIKNLDQRDFTDLTRAAYLGKKLTGDSAGGCVGMESRVLPSLPLLAVMKAGGPRQASAYCSGEERQKTGAWKQPVRACLDEDAQQLNLRDADGQLVKQIPLRHNIRPEPLPTYFKLDLARVGQLESANVTQHISALYSPSEAGAAWDPCPTSAPHTDPWKLRNPNEYAGRIVVVGVQRLAPCGQGEDVFCLTGSNDNTRESIRYGAELQANILSNLLTCVYIFPVSVGWNLFITSLMIALGMLTQLRFRSWLRWRLPFDVPLFNKRPQISFLLPGLAVLYFVVAFVAYKQWRVLFSDLPFHLVALFISYWLTGIARKMPGRV
ncbi:MAG TPA: CHAT domain-containing protein [Pyrinomonadaceae bacterium]|nr:CHAT domain-containing protein [Pyrinomonadaceae bacterium]